MATYELGNGMTIKAPEGMSLGGAMDLAVQQKRMTPQEAQMALEGQVSAPEAQGSLDAFGLNVADFAAQRSAGMIDPVNPQTMAQASEDYPVSSITGSIAPYVAAGIAAPNTIAGQALMGANLEWAREGSDLGSIAAEGALFGAGVPIGKGLSMGAGALATRVANKISSATSRLSGAASKTFSESFPDQRYAGWIDRAITDMGGFDPMQQARQKILNKSIAKSFGQNLDEFDKIGTDVIDSGFKDIGDQMNKIVPDRVDMDVAALKDVLLDPKMNLGTKGMGILDKMADDATSMSGKEFTALRRAVSDRGSRMLGSDPTGADDMFVVVGQIDDALNKAVGPSKVKELRKLREMYKNVAIAAKAPGISKYGDATVSDTLNALKNESSGYGRTFGTMRTDNLMPETADMMNTARELAALGRSYPNSGTAARNIGIQALSGDVKSLTQAVLAPVAGKGSQQLGKMSAPLPGAGKAGAILAKEQQLLSESESD